MSLFEAGTHPALDDNGNPISGAKWRFYLSGTTTPVRVYADADMATSLGAYITADSSGRFDPAYIDDGSLVRAVLEDAGGSPISPYDIDPVNPLEGGAFGISLKAFGVVGGGVTDDTAAFQAAVDFVGATAGVRSLFIPAGVYKLTAPITSARPLRIFGEGCEPYQGMLDTGGDVRGTGSWLYFAHGGKGLVFSDTDPISGVQLEHFGTFRDQPVPGPGWAPNDHDYDIYLRSCECHLDDLMLLNATRGIAANYGNYGKFNATRIRGQFMKVGISLDKQYDRAAIRDFHGWSYWQDDADVLAYQRANADLLYLLRTDLPQISDIFGINARSVIRIGQSADDGVFPGGTTTKLQGTNLALDISKWPLWVDNTVTIGCFLQLANLATQSDHFAGGYPVLVEGNSCAIDIVNSDLRLAEKAAVKVTGTGNQLNSSGRTRLVSYDHSAAGEPAFDIANGNYLRLTLEPDITPNLATGPVFSSTGNITAPWSRSYTPVVTSSAGAITSYTINQALFQKGVGGLVTIDLDITITNNGTGSGQLLITLPITTAGVISIPGWSSAGGSIAGNGVSAASALTVVKYDNSYPVATGDRIRLHGTYSVAI